MRVWENLKGLTNLQSLNLYDTIVNDAAIEHLKGLKEPAIPDS